MSDSPLELLKDEMNTDETYVKVNSIHRIPVVATLIGRDAVRSQLLPYLTTLLNEGEEVLFALSQELGALANFLTGSLSLLIQPLEQLAEMEETVVREQAVRSLVEIAGKMSDSEIISTFAPMVLNLAQGTQFTSRISAVGLFSCAYSRSGMFKEKFRAKFIELCHEETPIVRRSTAKQMGEICKVLEREPLVNDILPVFRQLAQDDQDQIRVICLDSLIPIARTLNKDDNMRHTLPVALAAGEDKSWRIRIQFAKKFTELAEAFGRDVTEMSMIQSFSQLLKDIESEVKIAALQSLLSTMKIISIEKIQSLIFPSINNLISDSGTTTGVKVALAEVLSSMSHYLGRDFTNTKILPLSLTLLQEDSHEVKLAVVKGIAEFSESIGAEVLTPNLVSQLQSLARDPPQWRLRETVIRLTVRLARILGQEVFISKLEDIFFLFLNDSVSSVRDAGIDTLNEICNIMTTDWVTGILMAKLREIFTRQVGYVYRRSAILALPHLPIINEQVLELISNATKDVVPNMRFVSCKVYADISKKHDVSSIKSDIEALLNDQDSEVRYFAQQALA